ncbi:MAG: JAB domain-containing protein [Acidobacteriia bacterium]|nr:JAB domain-containing protein [Terriglobia bacterium]
MHNTENPQQQSARTYRIPRQRLSLIRDGSLQSTWKRFSGSHEVFTFAQEELYADADREEFHILMLDSKNQLIGVNLVSQGSLSSAIVVPSQVFKAAIICNSASIICLHNHPSGCCEPSQEDRNCTSRLAEAGKILGIRVLDHVVVGQEAFFSFADSGLLGG